MSKAEWKVWSRLRDRQLAGFKFRRQYPIGPFFADFACLAARLVVEVDGDQHDPHYDAKRDKFISARGFKVVRIPVTDIDLSLDDVVETIFHALMGGDNLMEGVPIRPGRFAAGSTSPRGGEVCS
jgi:very-short-patch-repair endonuclease